MPDGGRMPPLLSHTYSAIYDTEKIDHDHELNGRCSQGLHRVLRGKAKLDTPR